MGTVVVERCADVLHMIRVMGAWMELPLPAVATAQCFFHRAWEQYREEVQHKFGAKEMGLACIFLASKCEECARKVRDYVNTFWAFLHPEKTLVLEIGGEDYWRIKTSMLRNEMNLLRMMAFDTEISHPFPLLFNYLKLLEAPYEVCQVSLNLLNDSYLSPLCVDPTFRHCEWCCSCIHISANLLDWQPPLHWHEPMEVSVQQLEDAACRVLDTYLQEDTLPSQHLPKCLLRPQESSSSSSASSAPSASSTATVPSPSV